MLLEENNLVYDYSRKMMYNFCEDKVFATKTVRYMSGVHVHYLIVQLIPLLFLITKLLRVHRRFSSGIFPRLSDETQRLHNK